MPPTTPSQPPLTYFPLLDLPLELRHLILYFSLVANCSRAPPTCPPRNDAGRLALSSEGIGHSWGFARHVHTEAGPFPVPALPLLLASHQLNEETLDVLAHNRDLRACELDIMFVRDAGLWPTWTFLPPLPARRFERVYARFRTVGAGAGDSNHGSDGSGSEVEDDDDGGDDDDEGMLSSGSGLSPWRGGDGGPPAAVWWFYDLLVGFLTMGPPLRSVLPPGGPDIQVEQLLIDVAPADRAGILDYPTEGLSPQERFMPPEKSPHHHHHHRLLLYLPQTWTPPRDARLAQGEVLLHFLHRELRMLFHRPRFGDILWERVGRVDLALDGEERFRVDPDGATSFGNLSPERQRVVARKRREAGFRGADGEEHAAHRCRIPLHVMH